LKVEQDCLMHVIGTLVLAIFRNTINNNFLLRAFLQHPTIQAYLGNTAISKKDLTLHESQICIARILHTFGFSKFAVYSETFGKDIWMIESIDHWVIHGLPEFEDESFKAAIRSNMLPYLEQLIDAVNAQPEIMNKNIIAGPFFYHSATE